MASSSSKPLSDTEKFVLAGVALLVAGSLSRRARTWVNEHLGPMLGPWRDRLSTTTLLLAFLMLLLAFLLGRVVWQRRAARHARVLVRLEATVTSVVGAHDDVKVQVRRWQRGRPRRFTVDYPVSWDDEIDGRRTKLRTALEQRVGGHLTGVWSETRSRVTFAAIPRRDETVRPEQEAGERVDTLLRQALPTITSTRVTAWTEEAQAQAAAEPEKVEESDKPGDVVHLLNRSARRASFLPGRVPAQVEVRYKPDVRTSSDRFRGSVAAMLTTQLSGRWLGEWDTQNDKVVFNRRHELSTLERHPLDKARVTNKYRLRYGTDEYARPVVWDISDPTQAHALFIGPTGGGKTTTLRALVLDASRQGVEVVGCDPKRIELMGLVGWPGVSYIATEVKEMAALIDDVYYEMDRRYLLIKQRKITREQLRPLVFVLDEFFILQMRLNRWWAENKKSVGGTGNTHPALGKIQEMLALARSAAIHLAIGIQRPDTDFLEGAGRDNIRHRASLTRLSPDGAKMMWNDSQQGTDLPSIPGRAIVSGPDGNPVEAQVWLTPDPDCAFLHLRSARERDELARLRPDVSTLPPAVFGPEGLLNRSLEMTAAEQKLVAEAKTAAQPPAQPEVDAAAVDLGKTEAPTPETEENVEWVERLVAAEAVVSEEFLVLDVEGHERTVQIDVDEDPADEDSVLLSWWDVESEDEGVLSLPRDETVTRLEAAVPVG